MSQSPNLNLPYLESGQAQKHVTHNEALRVLDAAVQLAVAAVSASPPGSPADGERHIVGATPSGAFTGHTNEIAAFQDGAWTFLAPKAGWRAWNIAGETLLVWTGSAWSEISAGGGGGGGDVVGPAGGVADGDIAVFDGTTGKAIKKDRGAIAYLGVGAAPDDTDTDVSNRLIVRGSRALFHAIPDAENPGTGDFKIQVSKETEGDSASFFFSTNFSGRAEFGLVESDAFKLKVSADGATWLESLLVDPATGAVEFPLGADLGPTKATAAQVRDNSAGKVLVTDAVWSAAGIVALTDAATIAVDLAAGFNFSVTLGGNRTLGNPSNAKIGQSGVIVVAQDGTGNRTLAFGSNWKNTSAVNLSSAAGKVDAIAYWVRSSTSIVVTGCIKDV